MPGKMLNRTEKVLLYWDKNKTSRELIAIFKSHGCEINRAYFYTMVRYYGLSCKIVRRNNFSDAVKRYFSDNPHASITDCANELKTSYSYVCNIVNYNDIPHLTHQKAKMNRLFRKEVVNYLLDKGFSYQDIGRLFDVKRQAIEQMYHA